jgi:hypothetical protein
MDFQVRFPTATAMGCDIGQDSILFLVDARRRHVELRLRHGNRLALRLDCKAVLLEIAGG